MDTRYMVTRFNVLRPHADRVLAGCEDEKAAREVMRGAMVGKDETGARSSRRSGRSCRATRPRGCPSARKQQHNTP